MSPFVPGVSTPDVPRTDPYIELERQAEALAARVLPEFPTDAPDDAYQLFGPGGTRITAGELRRLNDACRRARRLRI